MKSEKSESIVQTPKTPHKNAIFRQTQTRNSLQFNLNISDEGETNIQSLKSHLIEFMDEFRFYEIPESYFLQNYKIINKIGEGDYYEVFKVLKIQNHQNINCLCANNNKKDQKFDQTQFLFEHNNDLDQDNVYNNSSCVEKPEIRHNKGIIDCSRENTCFKDINYNNCTGDNMICENRDFKCADYSCIRQHNSDRITKNMNFSCTNSNTKDLDVTNVEINYSCVKKSKKVFTGEGNRKTRLKEVQILNLLKGKNNIVQILSSWEEKGVLFIETELCNYGNLKDLIHTVYFIEKTRLNPRKIKQIIMEIAIGLKSIHDMGIVHMDIKPENIFIRKNTLLNYCDFDSENLTFVIGDFNISKFLADEIHDDGDKKYMPSEILLNQAFYSSDIFSLGLIFLELSLGIVLPSSGEDWLNLRKNNFKDLMFTKISGKVKKFIFRMIDKDPSKRPTAREVVEAIENI